MAFDLSFLHRLLRVDAPPFHVEPPSEVVVAVSHFSAHIREKDDPPSTDIPLHPSFKFKYINDYVRSVLDLPAASSSLPVISLSFGTESHRLMCDCTLQIAIISLTRFISTNQSGPIIGTLHIKVETNPTIVSTPAPIAHEPVGITQVVNKPYGHTAQVAAPANSPKRQASMTSLRSQELKLAHMDIPSLGNSVKDEMEEGSEDMEEDY